MAIKRYDVRKLLKNGCTYSIALGKRGPGKTWSTFAAFMDGWMDDRQCGAYVRRWYEDIKTREMQSLADKMTVEGFVRKITDGQWDGMIYKLGAFYLTRSDPDNPEDPLVAADPLCRTFCLSKSGHYKSSGYSRQGLIAFDEFIPLDGTGGYIPGEFGLWANLISTLTRERPDCQILMLGNTIDRFCPYFGEMGLTHVRDQKPGTLDVYRYSDEQLTVAVEITDTDYGSKATSHYFAFDNPKLKMITDGSWEIGFYPRIPYKYETSDVAAVCYLRYNGIAAAGEVIRSDDGYWVFWRPQTKPIPIDARLIYDHTPSPSRRVVRDFSHTNGRLCDVINRLMTDGKAFYASNDIGYTIESFSNTKTG